MMTSSLGMPWASAAFKIRSARSNRCCAVSGRPFSSMASPTTAAPYFFTMGRMASKISALPLTELTMARPQQARRPASMTSGLVESICRGRETTDWMALTTSVIITTSSMPGRPTFTSKMSAPASC